MWNRLYLEYFKGFEKLSLPLAPLTLLSGLNSAGKSTALQALALLHQTAQEDEWSKSLLLNGSTISLGTASDVIDKIHGRKKMAIGIEADNYQCIWRMLSEDRAAYTIPFQEITLTDYLTPFEKSYPILSEKMIAVRRMLPAPSIDEFPQEVATHLSNQIYQLTYLGAERLGPRETYAISNPNKYQTVGSQGEYTPWYLFNYSDKKVTDFLQISKNPPGLQRQTEAYLDHFFPGAGFVVEPVKNANLVTLKIRTSQSSEYHRPQNVGYGLTHVLPIITACLGAKLENVVLVENPEAHLHPAAQALMGLFLARVAASGVQVILETHSDHVLNGVRRAVKDKKLSSQQVAIHFFKSHFEDESTEPQVISPLIDDNGNLDNWPQEFFDQFDKDTAYFADWDF
jgi:predicted ATPase